MRVPRSFLVLAVLGASVQGCGAGPAKATSAVAGLPEYTPAEAAVFGDVLGATVFGLPPEIPPADDPRIPECATRAEGIALVRVATVSEEQLAGKNGYTLTLTADPKPVSGRALESPLELHVKDGNPSMARVQASDTSLVGKRFLLLFRRYADAGEPKLHWHGEADDPSIRAIITKAKTLDAESNRAHTAP